MRIPFAKYHGVGNDFILIDDRDLSFPSSQSLLIASLCHRSLGIGADGLILLQPSLHADIRMRIFNSDGGEPAMCGNGIRCLVSFTRRLGWENPVCCVETGAGILECRIQDPLIGVQLGKPRLFAGEGFFELEGIANPLAAVETGVPHSVVFVDDLDQVDLLTIGRSIRFHPRFAPEGVNVNFAQILPDHSVAMRTYERGIEGETRACGTGAAAVGWIVAQHFSIDKPIKIYNKERKAILEVRCSSPSGIELWGEATHVFDGHVELERFL